LQNSPGFNKSCRTARDLAQIAEQPGILTKVLAHFFVG
jgi:hypothetical protein